MNVMKRPRFVGFLPWALGALLALGCPAHALRRLDVRRNPASPARLCRVAVAEFADETGHHHSPEAMRKMRMFANPGRIVADAVAAGLVGHGCFQVVERTDLAKILEEHSLQEAGIFVPGAAETVGRLLRVDAIVTGSVARLEEYEGGARNVASGTLKFVEVRSGEVAVSAAFSYKGAEPPEILLQAMVSELAERLSGDH